MVFVAVAAQPLRQGFGSQHRMWSPLIVVLSPCLDDRAGMAQGLEPVRVQAFVPELAIEALDVGALRRLARLDQFQLHTTWS